ncbi:alanine racemase [Candidatus Oleimmundimicrobium sp.]|uniref:alanine racemase n=1 Tax=Candidatus Oleimmundimicrobium sp. TaxID=3060597 RepID=UPI002725BB81|nr:alanine racemase [Candidatus Oleimmundimicrobium sp.]MDO8886026.1 alanine racemase [Candidatus Oleimmundimicrobium sp.]
MIYPRLTIDLKKIEHNSRKIVEQCRKNGIDVIGVTKGCLGNLEVARAMLNGGVSGIADSRISNIKKLYENGFNNLIALRQPMCDEAKETVKYSETCLISDVKAAAYLSDEAIKLGKTYKVILMVEMGDLREGILPEDLLGAADKILGLKHVKLLGIGANICSLPAQDSYQSNSQGEVVDCTRVRPGLAGDDFLLLVELAKSIKRKFGIEIEVISGGSSSTWNLMMAGVLPKEINQLRIGEAILLGQEPTSFKPIKGTHQDVFVLFAEILEVREKKYPQGWLKQAVVALGKQDVGSETLKPCFNGKILRVTADHMIVDVSDANETFSYGDILSVIPEYYALQMAMTSPFVLKKYI